ncbi:uncharacterized protein [Saccopteryx bilineata]|uniref:uncharacterized protein n=1 Tax=Saccopteryx bilineata TaxID=59482 RepID=UPI00338DDB39
MHGDPWPAIPVLNATWEEDGSTDEKIPEESWLQQQQTPINSLPPTHPSLKKQASKQTKTEPKCHCISSLNNRRESNSKMFTTQSADEENTKKLTPSGFISWLPKGSGEEDGGPCVIGRMLWWRGTSPSGLIGVVVEQTNPLPSAKTQCESARPQLAALHLAQLAGFGSDWYGATYSLEVWDRGVIIALQCMVPLGSPVGDHELSVFYNPARRNQELCVRGCLRSKFPG